MSTALAKLNAKIEEAAKTGPNMTVASKGGGGEYTLPAAGLVRLRMVGYYEVGQHDKYYEGKVTGSPSWAWIVFELSGPKHPPIEVDGKKYPQRMTVREPISMNEKAHFFKMFNQLNYAGKATHMAQLLGEAFLGQIVHYDSTVNGKTVKKASLRGKAGYAFTGPFREDPDTGDMKQIAVDAPLSELKAFIWDLADMDDWKSIYIDGVYEEAKGKPGDEDYKPAKTKNVIQEKIMSAKNWKSHPLYAQLQAGGKSVDIPDAEKPPVNEEKREAEAAAKAQEAEDDPLAGVA